MTKQIYYKKVGRKYVPVSEYDHELLGSIPQGTHIIMCYPGGQSTRYNIDPAFGPMIAAGRFASDAISKSIMDASALQAAKDRKPLTPEQIAAWCALQKAFGDEMYPLQYNSYRDAAEAGVAAMQQEADKLLKNPAVLAAYNQFMLLCELAKTHKDSE